MSADDLERARDFLEALAVAAKTGDRDAIYPFLASDVEWVTPQRELRSVGEVREGLTWLRPGTHLELDFEEGTLDLGDGRVVTDVHELFRMKDTGELAYERDLRIELTIREGKVARYEMRFAG